ncbi:hypothetical protein C0995_004909 [Termitomyces sp. Mi166|nr:hypothetical protein C0995_004909 [Termitomyces sp. Mi166\
MPPRNAKTNTTFKSNTLAPPRRPLDRSARPTHSIPLHTNPSLRSQIATFQDQLLTPSASQNANTTMTLTTPNSSANTTKVRGLDPSIVIPPIRFHLTLGVMALSPEPDTLSRQGPSATTPIPSYTPAQPDSAIASNSSNPQETRPMYTVSTALGLLRSLKPQIDAILSANATTSGSAPSPTINVSPSVTTMPTKLEVILDALDILRPAKPPKPSKPKSTPTQVQTTRSSISKSLLTEPQADSSTFTLPTVISTEQSENDVWADVLYLAPQETPALRQIADLVHGEFKRAGYITETRPLKLHCTVLNTSKRQPARARGQPFCYSDILCTDALKLIACPPSTALSNVPCVTSERWTSTSPTPAIRPSKPTAVPIALGRDSIVQVHSVELWIMGSRAPDGAYVSCGGVQFGDVSRALLALQE